MRLRIRLRVPVLSGVLLAVCSVAAPAFVPDAAASAASASLPQLFQKTKQQFRYASYTEALRTLEEIELLADKYVDPSEYDRFRGTLIPAVAFYRGACLAALGRTDEARSEFELYRTFVPNAVLDPALYSKKIVTVFEQSRVQRRPLPVESTGTGLTASYRAFQYAPSNAPFSLEEDWASGPVQFLMTPEERRRYSQLSDPVSRSEFVTEFWKVRDPRPETPENEFREEFERRIAYADIHFAQDEVRGSMTDRGMVFVLLGPATWVGRKPIGTGEDRNDPSGMFMNTRNAVVVAQSGLDPRASGPMVDRMTGPNNSLPEAAQCWVEVWHYRREILPAHVPYQQVDFEFITRPGYGKNVLQRQDTSLTTLAAARHSPAEHS